tara:strand:+ start:1731 stop:1949 length:219 start_codon:yes stop_codon:yes gene_type:complete
MIKKEFKLTKKQIATLKSKGWKNVEPTGFWFGMDFDEKRNNLAQYVDTCKLDCDDDTTGYDFLCFGYRKIKE